MRALRAIAIIMGIMIVGGTITLAVLIVQRLKAVPTVAASLVLDQPVGTHIAGIASASDRFALLLQGGGPDRVIFIDPRSGALTGQVRLAR
ncbi:MAG: hypothetical protein JO110_06860 [Acetobacteraceae bacterium]|nr:hypothetical protein [Acetobacteraceae bacterium]